MSLAEVSLIEASLIEAVSKEVYKFDGERCEKGKRDRDKFNTNK